MAIWTGALTLRIRSSIGIGIAGCLALLVLAGLVAPETQAAYRGPNGKIAFERSSDIFTIRPGGSGLTNVTKTSGWYEEHPSISPDGRRVAYSLGAVGNAPDEDIFVERIGGSAPVSLTKNFRSRYYGLHDPSWEPNGKRVAFYCFTRNAQGELCRVNADGTGYKQLTNCGCVFQKGIEWNKSGILYQHVGPAVLKVAPPSGGTGTTVDPDPSDGDPNWFPTGAKFVFESPDPRVGSLRTRSANGSNETLIWTSDVTGAYGPAKPALQDPAYSPDGTKLAVNVGCCVANTGNPQGLSVWNPANGAITSLTGDSPFPYDPDWGVSPSTLTLSIAKTAAKIRASGSLTPASPGDTVRVVLYRKRANGTWASLGAVNDALNASSQYLATFNRPAPGTCKVRASFAGDATAAPASTVKQFAC